MYVEYLVTRSEVISVSRTMFGKHEMHKQYICELVGNGGHKINFRLYLGECVGASQGRQQYEIVKTHIKVGSLLHCEFGYLFPTSYLRLYLLRFKECSPIASRSGKVISGEDFLNPNRGYWATTKVHGDWICPTHIPLSGEAYVPIKGYPALSPDSSSGSHNEGGYLKWIPPQKPKWFTRGKLLSSLRSFFVQK